MVSIVTRIVRRNHKTNNNNKWIPNKSIFPSKLYFRKVKKV